MDKIVVSRIESDIILKLGNKSQIFTFIDTLFEKGSKLYLTFTLNISLLNIINQIIKLQQASDLELISQELMNMIGLLNIEYDFKNEKEWLAIQSFYLELGNKTNILGEASKPIIANLVHLFNLIFFRFIQNREKESTLIKLNDLSTPSEKNRITVIEIENYKGNLFEESIELAYQLKANHFESLSFQYAVFTSPFLSTSIFSTTIPNPFALQSPSLTNQRSSTDGKNSLNYTHLSHLSPTYDPYVVRHLGYNEAVEIFSYPNAFISAS